MEIFDGKIQQWKLEMLPWQPTEIKQAEVLKLVKMK